MARPSLPSLALVTAALAAAAAGVGVACEDAQSYVYTAQKYDPTAGCLAAYTPVELVNGSGASSTCPATCLTVGDDLFVSTMCPPLPAIATAVPDDAGTCIPALAAAKRGGTCDEPAEGGADEDAADPDAATDPDAAEPDASDLDAADASLPIEDAAEAG